MAKIDNQEIYKKQDAKGTDLLIATDTVSGETITLTVESIRGGEASGNVDLTNLGNACIEYTGELTVKNVLGKYEELICRLIQSVGGIVNKEFLIEPSVILKGGVVNPIGSCVVPGETITISYYWSKTNFSFSQLNTEVLQTLSNTTNFNDVGNYYAYMKCDSSKGNVYWSSYVFTVLPLQNIIPSVNSGLDQTIQLPNTSINLSGTASDIDGNIVSYDWSKTFGGSASIMTPFSIDTQVRNLLEGMYVFKLTVIDNSGATNSDSLTVQVLPEIDPQDNIAPNVTVNDNFIVFLGDDVNLSASATDVDGTVTQILWTKLVGGTADITSPNSFNTTITRLEVDQYAFRATVTDNEGATGFADVNVIVSSISGGLTVDAGIDQVINLNTDILTLTALSLSVNPITYLWTKESGGSSTIDNEDSDITTVRNLQVGNYTFKVVATDTVDFRTGEDTVDISVIEESIGSGANLISLSIGNCDDTPQVVSTDLFIEDSSIVNGTIVYTNSDATTTFNGNNVLPYKLANAELNIFLATGNVTFNISTVGVVSNVTSCISGGGGGGLGDIDDGTIGIQ